MLKCWWTNTQEVDMKKIIGLFFILFSLNCYSTGSATANSATTTPLNSRYEIVSSTLALKHTYRLDRFCGHVSQLVKQENGDFTWQLMTTIGLPKCQIDKPRYQIFTSGLAVRHTYLINTDTGKTWQVMTFKHSNGNEDMGWFALD